MLRVVSLIASSTEIVHALGQGETLVGRSHECDYPPEVEALQVVTETKIPTDGTSYEIDQRVKALVQEALSVYRVNGELLRTLEPDLIVTQTQCEVCAVSLRDVEAALCNWLSGRPRVVSLEPNKLIDVWADIERVAEALDVPQHGHALVAKLKQRVEAIAEESQRVSDRPTVACIEWIDPLMAAGNWVPELVELAGGVNLFGAAGRHSPWMEWDELVAANPEIIVVLPCGFNVPRSRAEMRVLTERSGWAQLQAVLSGQVILVDGVQYFNRPGPRLVESLEILAEVLHPDRFKFGHRRAGWEVL